MHSKMAPRRTATCSRGIDRIAMRQFGASTLLVTLYDAASQTCRQSIMNGTSLVEISFLHMQGEYYSSLWDLVGKLVPNGTSA